MGASGLRRTAQRQRIGNHEKDTARLCVLNTSSGTYCGVVKAVFIATGSCARRKMIIKANSCHYTRNRLNMLDFWIRHVDVSSYIEDTKMSLRFHVRLAHANIQYHAIEFIDAVFPASESVTMRTGGVTASVTRLGVSACSRIIDSHAIPSAQRLSKIHKDACRRK